MELKDVENLAELSRLELSQEEKESLLHDFDSILHYIQSIEKVELKDAEPALDLKNVWREDAPEERDFSRDLITSQFPAKQDGFLKVKKVL